MSKKKENPAVIAELSGSKISLDQALVVWKHLFALEYAYAADNLAALQAEAQRIAKSQQEIAGSDWWTLGSTNRNDVFALEMTLWIAEDMAVAMSSTSGALHYGVDVRVGEMLEAFPALRTAYWVWLGLPVGLAKKVGKKLGVLGVDPEVLQIIGSPAF